MCGENYVSVWVAESARKLLKWHEPHAILVVADLFGWDLPLAL